MRSFIRVNYGIPVLLVSNSLFVDMGLDVHSFHSYYFIYLLGF